MGLVWISIISTLGVYQFMRVIYDAQVAMGNR